MLHRLRKLPRKSLLVALAALIIIAVGVYAQHRSRLNSPVIPSTTPLSQPKKTASNSGSSQQPTPSSSPSQSSTVSGPPPIVPYGNFVSNHHPGGTAPTAEASTCNTSAGASCYIKFTNGSIVKQLDPETANSNGTTIWYWDVKTAGITTGSWTITAVATLNGQTKTANDSQPLVVQ